VLYREIAFAEIPERHPVSVFHAYWLSKTGASGVPLRNDINPMDIPTVVPWLMILETVESRKDGLIFRYRLAGTGCTEMFGIDYTGKTFGEGLLVAEAERREREFLRIIKDHEPVFSWAPLPIEGRDFITVYRGVFPVSSTGDKVDRIFAVVARDSLRLR
jgi:hypothetical protein